VTGSTVQEIVNGVTTADGCVHTADATQLDSNKSRRRYVLGLMASRTDVVYNNDNDDDGIDDRHCRVNGGVMATAEAAVGSRIA